MVSRRNTMIDNKLSRDEGYEFLRNILKIINDTSDWKEAICLTKIEYRTKADALKAANNTMKKNKKYDTLKPAPYKCDICGMWHIGRKEK